MMMSGREGHAAGMRLFVRVRSGTDEDSTDDVQEHEPSPNAGARKTRQDIATACTL